MRKILPVLLLFFWANCRLYSQVLPKEGSKLHYRLIGFSFPAKENSNGASLEIADGNFNREDSFKKHIISSVACKSNKIIAEVPAFGSSYTWRVGKGKLHHFSTTIVPMADTSLFRLRIIKKADKYKDAYVFLDGTKTLYDMDGHPVWYLPDINNIGLPPRDLKLSGANTITFLMENHAYEINYDADILWKSPNGPKTGATLGHNYNHEFTRLDNGHYMVSGRKDFLWELPNTIDSAVLNAPGELIVHDTAARKYYQRVELGTIFEFDSSGKLIWSWDPSDYLKKSDLYQRRTYEGLFDMDVHENSFYFDQDARVVYISFRDVSRVLKVKYPEGIVLNCYGGKYVPGDREVVKSLFCHQHSCRHSKDGYLYLYNNNGCNPDEHPKVLILKEPATPEDTAQKIWEYDCNVEGMDEKNTVDEVFSAGGNVIELPDHSIFTSMCVVYGNIFIVDRNKQLVWSAISEAWLPVKKKWKAQPSYRASIIINRKELEDLIWNGAGKK